jgi:hypothetical protein
MPHSTFEFPFEGKVLRWASTMSEQLTRSRHGGFLLVLNAAGVAQALHCEADGPNWRTMQQHVQAAGEPHLFYDPFEGPEYTWISWRGIPCPLMERLLGASFTPEDFVSVKTKARTEYPADHGVMF